MCFVGARKYATLSKPYACHQYILEVSKKLLSNKKVMALLEKALKKKHESIATEMTNLTRKRAVFFNSCKAIG